MNINKPEYLTGDTVRIANNFTDKDDNLYDPLTVSLEIFDPQKDSLIVVTYASGAIKKADTGSYYYDFDIPAEQGYYVTVWTAITNGFTDVSEDQFYARIPAEKLYIAVDEVKSFLMSEGFTMDDDVIRRLIRFAMSEVDTITGRSFIDETATTEWFNTDTANPNTLINQIFLTKMPVQTITSLKEFDRTGLLVKEHIGDFYEDNGIVELLTGSFGHQRHRVECVYTHGYTAIPGTISQLTGIVTQIEVMRQYLIMQDNEITGFSVPDIGDIQVGETYMSAEKAIAGLYKKRDVLIVEIGNLRNDIFIC